MTCARSAAVALAPSVAALDWTGTGALPAGSALYNASDATLTADITSLITLSVRRQAADAAGIDPDWMLLTTSSAAS